MSTQRKEAEGYSFDLVVVGGGMAGVCAAVAAARSGAKVAIVQERPVFGGTSSSEIRVVPYGCAHSHVWSTETGIAHEIQLNDRANNHEEFFDHGMMNSLWDMTLSETVRREPNLTSFLNTSVRAVDSEALDAANPSNRCVLALHASQTGSEREFVFRATQFIDASGDGTVGFLAGADYRYGREARSEFGENLAPVKADDVTMGSTITMRARDIGHPVPYQAPPWIEEYKTLEAIGLDRKLYHLGKPTYGGYWWLEVCNPWHQIDDNAAIRDELHRHVLGVWNFIKNHSEHQEQAQNYALEWIGQIPGKRESRRLMGDVIFSEHDCHEDKKWPDGVSYAGWWIDLHIPGGILNKDEPGERENVDDNYKHWIRVAPFSIPLRAMYSRNVENLWMAGRCYSLTHAGLGPVRVQLTLAMQGQAVGTAAAYAVKHHLTPRQTANPADAHIQNVRQQLLRDDARVLGLKNQDSLDLARHAKATATSEMPFDIGTPQQGKWTHLDKSRAQILPITGERIESVAVFLKNESDAPAQIVAELQPMERIWDRPQQPFIACEAARLAPGFEGWVELPFQTDVKPGPHRLALRLCPGVSWAEAGPLPVGTLSQYLYECAGGVDPKYAHLPNFGPDAVDIPAYKHWRQGNKSALAARVSPNPQPFAASMINNGCAWPEDLPNLWISHPAQGLPQSCDFAWDAPQSFNEVLLAFDTDLSMTGGRRQPLSRPADCIRHFNLQAHTQSGWETVYEANDNYQRRHIARFERVTTDALRLEVLATNGTGQEGARVFEIRVYNR